MGTSGHAVEDRTVNRGDGGSIPPTAVSKLRQFRSPPQLPLSFGRDTNSRWSFLSGVYARGSKRSHTGGKCVTCSGLKNSHWTLNTLQMLFQCLSSLDLTQGMVLALATRPPGHPATRPPGHPATRPPGHPATRSPGHPATRPPGHPATRPPGHQPPSHQPCTYQLSRNYIPVVNHAGGD